MFDTNLNFTEFCGKCDEELALAARDSKAAASALILRYSKLIMIKAELLSGTQTEADDLRQEGLIGLLKAVDSFDPNRGVKFSTFAETCIVNKMRTFLTRSTKNPVSESLDELTSEQITDEETPESIYINKELFSELCYAVDHILSLSERQVFCLCIQGHSYEETAEKLGISIKSVDNAMQRARRKIKAYCIDES